MTTVELTLLENGLDFILSGVERLTGEPAARDLKYAVLHLCAGIELVLKERLRRKDWKLLFENLKEADKVLYERGDFFSVRYHVCLERLENDCGVKFTDAEKAALKAFRSKRNPLEHFRASEPAIALRAASATVLDFLVDFIANELDGYQLTREEKRLLEAIRSKLAEFDDFVKQRHAAIKATLKASTGPTVDCPWCLQTATVLYEGATCHFCGYKGDGAAAADLYVEQVLEMSHYETVKDGGEWPVARCPSCEAEALVTEEASYAGDEIAGPNVHCFECEESWTSDDIDVCLKCNNPMEQSEMSVCDDCFQEAINED